jgi:hypothetical protein
MCGHNGPPGGPDRQFNYARLVLEDRTEVARSFPPRSDMAQRIECNLSLWTGKRGHVEVVDGITELDGFAWLAVSRFEPRVITVPDYPVGDAGAVAAELYRLAGRLKLSNLTNEIIAATDAKNTNLLTRLAATDSLVMLAPERAIAPLASTLADANLPTSAREQAAQQLAQRVEQGIQTGVQQGINKVTAELTAAGVMTQGVGMGAPPGSPPGMGAPPGGPPGAAPPGGPPGASPGTNGPPGGPGNQPPGPNNSPAQAVNSTGNQPKQGTGPPAIGGGPG